MMIQLFKRRADGTIDFADSYVPETMDKMNELLALGYEPVQVENEGRYKDTGELLTDEELDAIRNAPRAKTANDILGENLVKQRLVALKAEKARDNLGKQLVGLKLDVMKIKGGTV